MAGAFSFWDEWSQMTKTWLSFQEQVQQLRERGMRIDDDAACCHFLSCVNYYRFSGYFRYWQQAPIQGNNNFIANADFTTIRDVYFTEQRVAGQVVLALRRIEILLRTKFAHYYAQRASPCGALTRGGCFTQPSNEEAWRVQDYVIRDLDRSKEKFIEHYRDTTCKNTQGKYLPDAYDATPVWVAVESLSFGTLSRCIQASEQNGVLDDISRDINVSRRFLAVQVKSFVYLRNRIAHHARIWNHSVLDAPGLPPNIKRRAFQEHGMFAPRSVYTVMVAIDVILKSSKMESDWLTSTIDPIIENNSLLKQGLTVPRKYGELYLKDS